jgi:hypothetical protein
MQYRFVYDIDNWAGYKVCFGGRDARFTKELFFFACFVKTKCNVFSS